MKKIIKQIFYDQAHLRWRYSKRTLMAMVVFLAAIFGTLVVSLFIAPDLPILNL